MIFYISRGGRTASALSAIDKGTGQKRKKNIFLLLYYIRVYTCNNNNIIIILYTRQGLDFFAAPRVRSSALYFQSFDDGATAG